MAGGCASPTVSVIVAGVLPLPAASRAVTVTPIVPPLGVSAGIVSGSEAVPDVTAGTTATVPDPTSEPVVS